MTFDNVSKGDLSPLNLFLGKNKPAEYTRDSPPLL